MKGDLLGEEEKNEIIKKLARYSGLSELYIEQTRMRINIHKFVKELLRNESRTVGRLDGRYKGIDVDDTGINHEYDPLLTFIQGPYTATFNDYVSRELNFKSKLPYNIFASLWQNWKYEGLDNQILNVAENLRSAMSKNPFLKVIVLSGYYDLGTPYMAADYTFDHMSLDKSLHKNITKVYYRSGHMMYLHEPSLKQMAEDLRHFIDSANGLG